MKKQLDRIEAKLDEILRVETRLLKNTANVNGSKGLLQTIQAWCDSKNGVCLSERGELVYDGTQSIKPAQDIIINNLPSEPDWSKAPEWANWFQICKSGNGFWNEDEPVFNEYFDEWFLQGSERFQHAGKFSPQNYQNSLRQRPKPEQITITANLNVDTDGYLAGKKSFISAYVDLLLARMAMTSSFSDDDYTVTSLESFDVITFDDHHQSKSFAVVLTSDLRPTGRITVSHYMVLENKVGWVLYANEQFNSHEYNFHTITELEAVEFRKAMEAVYG